MQNLLEKKNLVNAKPGTQGTGQNAAKFGERIQKIIDSLDHTGAKPTSRPQTPGSTVMGAPEGDTVSMNYEPDEEAMMDNETAELDRTGGRTRWPLPKDQKLIEEALGEGEEEEEHEEEEYFESPLLSSSAIEDEVSEAYEMEAELLEEMDVRMDDDLPIVANIKKRRTSQKANMEEEVDENVSPHADDEPAEKKPLCPGCMNVPYSADTKVATVHFHGGKVKKQKKGMIKAAFDQLRKTENRIAWAIDMNPHGEMPKVRRSEGMFDPTGFMPCAEDIGFHFEKKAKPSPKQIPMSNEVLFDSTNSFLYTEDGPQLLDEEDVRA